MEIHVVGESVSIRLGNQNPAHVPMDPEILKAEFNNLVDYLFKGGNIGQHGEIGQVLGANINVAMLMSIEAPAETWAKLKEWQNVINTSASAPAFASRPENRADRRRRAREKKAKDVSRGTH